MASQPTVIKFFAPVNEVTIYALMGLIESRMKEGRNTFSLLISSLGGSVFHGLSAFNYLRGIPADITTHNFGSVDSIGVVLYCGGKRRFCVPQARFLLHGVSIPFQHGANLKEKQLEEKLKSLRSDVENIARAIAASTGQDAKKVAKAMLDRSTLNPEQALKWGLVHEIKTELYPLGSEVISIQYQEPQK